MLTSQLPGVHKYSIVTVGSALRARMYPLNKEPIVLVYKKMMLKFGLPGMAGPRPGRGGSSMQFQVFSFALGSTALMIYMSTSTNSKVLQQL